MCTDIVSTQSSEVHSSHSKLGILTLSAHLPEGHSNHPKLGTLTLSAHLPEGHSNHPRICVLTLSDCTEQTYEARHIVSTHNSM